MSYNVREKTRIEFEDRRVLVGTPIGSEPPAYEPGRCFVVEEVRVLAVRGRVEVDGDQVTVIMDGGLILTFNI